MGSSSSTTEYPPNDSAMNTWKVRAERVGRRLDIDVETGNYHGPVKVCVEDLEALADKIETRTRLLAERWGGK